MGLQRTELTPVKTKLVESRWRRIVTPIPVPQSLEAIRKLRALEPASVAGMPPILWHEAEGFLVRDPYGNQWIDLTSGIMIANVGHAHPAICAAIKEAVDDKLLLSYIFPTDKRRQLLNVLSELSPIADAKAILFCAGTEATECAMMLMRRHGCTISQGKAGILSFEDSYHGRTLAATLAGGRAGASGWISREDVKHYQIPFPFCPRCPRGKAAYDKCGQWCFEQCLVELKKRQIDPSMIAGIIAEPLPGWATWPIPVDFATAMIRWAKNNEILLAFDEVQCGCGRAGRMFGFEHLGIMPDIYTLGKGLTSSVPVSALVGRRDLLDQPDPGEMSSTHGGNPICVAAAIANLEVLKNENLAEASRKTGRILLERLQTLQKEFPEHFYSIHGRGLFISAHLRRPEDGQPATALADAIVHGAVRRGVLMFPTARGFLKFVPPLCIAPKAALEAADVIHDCFVELKDKV